MASNGHNLEIEEGKNPLKKKAEWLFIINMWGCAVVHPHMLYACLAANLRRENVNSRLTSRLSLAFPSPFTTFAACLKTKGI